MAWNRKGTGIWRRTIGRWAENPIEYATIYSVPGVYGMLIYLGQTGKADDIIALDAFDRRYLNVPREEWTGAVIQAIDVEGF